MRTMFYHKFTQTKGNYLHPQIPLNNGCLPQHYADGVVCGSRKSSNAPWFSWVSLRQAQVHQLVPVSLEHRYLSSQRRLPQKEPLGICLMPEEHALRHSDGFLLRISMMPFKNGFSVCTHCGFGPLHTATPYRIVFSASVE